MLDTAIVENEDGRFLVLRNDTLGQHLLRGERWEPHFTKLINEIVKPGDVVADVGANIGYNAVVLSSRVGDTGAVHAFEPLRIVFQQLCANALLNACENIYVHNVVVGSENNVPISMIAADYHQDGVNLMNACVGGGGEIVMMRTLDSFDFPSLSFLKIDVQGFEPHVLKGAEQTIRNHRPIIFIEIEEPQLKNLNSTSEELMLSLLSLEHALLWSEAVSLTDWVAVPRERPELIEITKRLLGPETREFQVG